MNKKILIFIAIALLIFGVWIILSRQHSAQSGSKGSPQQAADMPSRPIGQRTKTADCIVNGGLQDAACTPGAIFSNATKEQICVSGYSSTVRNVPTSEKNEVYKEYGISSHVTGQYEVDHLVSLELGGSNDISNLWPEAADPLPGFHQKDAVENYLHAQVCNGSLPLAEAQQEIATNWLMVYNQLHP